MMQEESKMMEKPQEDNRKWSKASFRIFGDTLIPEEIRQKIGLDATFTGIKGEPKHPNSSRYVNRTSIWILKCPLKDLLPMEDHLNWLLDRLEPKLDVIHSLAEEFSVDFFCGYSSGNGQGGFALDSAMLVRLAKLGVRLELDLYPPETELDEEAHTVNE
jgi:hypothetical protein